MSDVGEAYLGWFRREGSERIVASSAMTDLDALRDYVAEREKRCDVMFLGIFETDPLRHIGNIKFEPVNPEAGFAVLGIFLGDPGARGKGVATEVITACGIWLKAHRSIEQIILGVESDNEPAIRAYRKVGFEAEASPFLPAVPGVQTMVWRP